MVGFRTKRNSRGWVVNCSAGSPLPRPRIRPQASLIESRAGSFEGSRVFTSKGWMVGARLFWFMAQGDLQPKNYDSRPQKLESHTLNPKA